MVDFLVNIVNKYPFCYLCLVNLRVINKRVSKLRTILKNFAKVRMINIHWVKSVRIRSYSGPHFPAFGLNLEYLSVFSPNAENCGPE